jgi:hypothetical protein
MHDLKRYWAEVRTKRASLPEFSWLIELDRVHPPIEVGSDIAARLLTAQSHRLATEAEVGSQQALETVSKRQRMVEKLRRDGVAIVPI